MKKIIFIAVSAFILSIVGAVGGAYAVDHIPVQGNKLVGYGALGKMGTNPIIKDASYFNFSNPDCVKDIIIDRVSILRRTPDGLQVAYEGPYRVVTPEGDRIEVPLLKPHGIGIIQLWDWMPDVNGGWKSEEDAKNQNTATFTVEIVWSAEGGTCALMGYGHRMHSDIIPGVDVRTAAQYLPMVNMRQTAK